MLQHLCAANPLICLELRALAPNLQTMAADKEGTAPLPLFQLLGTLAKCEDEFPRSKPRRPDLVPPHTFSHLLNLLAPSHAFSRLLTPPTVCSTGLVLVAGGGAAPFGHHRAGGLVDQGGYLLP